MNATKKPHHAVALTYEDALGPIAENLYQRMVCADRQAASTERGDHGLAETLQRFEIVYGIKADALSDFAARLFCLSFDEVIRNANERALEIYEERRNG